MPSLDLIAPSDALQVEFAAAPAHNILASFFSLSQTELELSEWVTKTRQILSTDQINNIKYATNMALSLLPENTGMAFDVWLNELKTLDPDKWIDMELEAILHTAGLILGSSDLPDKKTLLTDRGVFLGLMQQLHNDKGSDYDHEMHSKNHELMQTPGLRKEMTVNQLAELWEIARSEWDRVAGMIQDSVQAFQSLDFSGKSRDDIILSVTRMHSIPQQWRSLIGKTQKIVFIPSAHIGPYKLLLALKAHVVFLVVPAHIPAGASIKSAALQRSELLTRLTSLADDTRLQILELISHKGELTTPQVMAELGLSQSSASRHLNQLSATGFLSKSKKNGAKQYSISPERLNELSNALKDLLS